MSNGTDNPFERLFKLLATVCKLVLDGKRDPVKIANIFQTIISGSVESSFENEPDSKPTLPIEPTMKFAELIDLGTITVPDDYVHHDQADVFGRGSRFPNPSRVLKHGDKFRVRAFRQIVPGTTTSEERMAFLATQKAIYTGAQGASLIFDQKRNQLPKGFWYASFDEKDRLWTDAHGYHGVPLVGARLGGVFHRSLGHFEGVWFGFFALFCFCDIEPVSGE